MNRKIIKGYFLWSIPFLLFACNETAPASAKKATDPRNSEWYVAYREKKEEEKNDTFVRRNNDRLGVYALRFYPNGNYTLCADLLFEQGKWKFDEQKKLLVLVPSDKEEEDDVRYLVDQALPGNKTQFSFYHGATPDKSNPDAMLEVNAIANQSTSDPYSPSMNSWRIKPTQPETPGQIQQRVVSYLNFLLALYTHAKENGLENAGGSWYPHPVKFYSNKVSMAYADELIDWYNCFYNEQQGIEGYQLISGALMNVKVEGKDDVSRNINCTEQLLKQVQK